MLVKILVHPVNLLSSINFSLKLLQSWNWSCFTLPNWIAQRAVLCLLAHLGFILLYIMRSNMSVAIVLMTKYYSVVENDQLVKVCLSYSWCYSLMCFCIVYSLQNQSTPLSFQRVDFDWDLQEQGILLSSFFVGYLISQVPGGYFAAKWGGRRVFGLGVLLAALVSITTPICGSYFGYFGFLTARILCGLFEVLFEQMMSFLFLCL